MLQHSPEPWGVQFSPFDPPEKAGACVVMSDDPELEAWLTPSPNVVANAERIAACRRVTP